MLCIASYALNAQTIDYSTWGKGIRFTTKDSTGLVKMSARIQNLFIIDQQLTPAGADPAINGLTRRARLKFDGFAVSPRLTYKIELGLSNRDTRFSSDAALVGGNARIVMDAVLKYRLLKSTTLWFGQTKLPGNRERVVSSQKLQFVDRSLVNSRFNIDRDFGVQLHHKFKLGEAILIFKEALSLGEGRNMIVADIGGLAYTGRVEFLPMGSFSSKGDYVSSDLSREETPKLSIGVVGDFNQGAIRQGGQLGNLMLDTAGNYVQSDLTSVMADLILKYQGLSLMCEAAYRESSLGDFRDANGNSFRQGFGYTGQLGYLFKSNYEIAGRYTRLGRIKGEASAVNNVEQYTLGLSKYIKGHNLKVQTDLTYERALATIFANDNLIFRIQTEVSF